MTDLSLSFVAGALVMQGDARDLPLEDACVDLIVTSPPYFALRSYRDGGEHYDGQIGSEATPAEFIDALTECMVEWWRVLKPSGSVWINLGDKYAGSGGHNNSGLGKKQTFGTNWREHDRDVVAATRRNAPDRYNQSSDGIRTKSLMGLPWRFAIAQIDASWILRAEVVWDKPNSLPESVTDRVRRSHEQWFHFTKTPHYFSAVDEIREPYKDADFAATGHQQDRNRNQAARLTTGYDMTEHMSPNPLGRMPGSVWSIASEPLIVPDDVRKRLDLPDHFATFPQEWPRRLILGWSPSGICTECGEGRRPITDRMHEQIGTKSGGRTSIDLSTPDGHGGGWDAKGYPITRSSTTIVGEECACDEPTAPTTPAVILDPFGGTGTVAGVARTLGRFGISNDLSADYNRLATWRIFESGHFTKTEQRTWAERQRSML